MILSVFSKAAAGTQKMTILAFASSFFRASESKGLLNPAMPRPASSPSCMSMAPMRPRAAMTAILPFWLKASRAR